jgi:hypothetical protein
MDVAAVHGRRDLDAGHELESTGGTSGRGFPAGSKRIVICETQHGDARRRCPGDELGRRAPAV